ncbi:MAG: diguanylate cyclase [Anaerolineales bacterium]|nr:diguanylate cyclase [Anaerolineales bacterium]
MTNWERVTSYLDALLNDRDEQGWKTRKWVTAALPLVVYFPVLIIAHRYVGTISLVLALIPSIFWGLWLGPNPGSAAAFLLINPHYLMFLLLGETMGTSGIIELLIAHVVIATITYFITNGFYLRKSLAEQLNESRRAEARFKGLFDHTGDMVFIIDLDLRIVDVNDVGLILLGYHRDELLGKSYREIVSPDEHADLDRRIEANADGAARMLMYERTFVHKDGSKVVAELNAGLITDQQGRPMHYQVICRDIRGRKAAETALYERATQDALTGLYNRSMFSEILPRAIERAKRSNRKMGIIFIDLDGFKKVNDIHGHHTGDEVLKSVAKRLGSTVRGVDAVARLGGDEFAVIVEYLVGHSDAQQVANAIEAVLSEPYTIEQQMIHIGASTGVSLYPDDTTSPTELLTTSDMRMYKAKRKKYESSTTVPGSKASSSH